MINKLLFTSTFLLTFTAISCAQQNGVPTISPKDVKTQLDEGKDFTLFDVRRQEEVDGGVIDPAAVNYDFYSDDFDDNLAELDKEQTYYVYCHSGGRSAKTVERMKEMGFKNVFNVDGGIIKWQADGMKLVKKE